jgi:hypothetical protein
LKGEAMERKDYRPMWKDFGLNIGGGASKKAKSPSMPSDPRSLWSGINCSESGKSKAITECSTRTEKTLNIREGSE